MKFILELEAKEVAHLSKKGILEAIVQEFEDVFGEKKEETTLTPVKESKPKKKEEVKEVVKEKKEETEEVKETKSTMCAAEFKTRLVTLTKAGKKDEVKKVLTDRGYTKVSDVKEEDFDEIIKELS